MFTQKIVLGTANQVTIPINLTAIQTTIRQGNHLQITLKNGDTILLENYFDMPRSLVLNDEIPKEIKLSETGEITQINQLTGVESQTINTVNLSNQASEAVAISSTSISTVATNYVLPLAAGFTVGSTLGNSMNDNGTTENSNNSEATVSTSTASTENNINPNNNTVPASSQANVNDTNNSQTTISTPTASTENNVNLHNNTAPVSNQENISDIKNIDSSNNNTTEPVTQFEKDAQGNTIKIEKIDSDNNQTLDSSRRTVINADNETLSVSLEVDIDLDSNIEKRIVDNIQQNSYIIERDTNNDGFMDIITTYQKDNTTNSVINAVTELKQPKGSITVLKKGTLDTGEWDNTISQSFDDFNRIGNHPNALDRWTYKRGPIVVDERPYGNWSEPPEEIESFWEPPLLDEVRKSIDSDNNGSLDQTIIEYTYKTSTEDILVKRITLTDINMNQNPEIEHIETFGKDNLTYHPLKPTTIVTNEDLNDDGIFDKITFVVKNKNDEVIEEKISEINNGITKVTNHTINGKTIYVDITNPDGSTYFKEIKDGITHIKQKNSDNSYEESKTITNGITIYSAKINADGSGEIITKTNSDKINKAITYTIDPNTNNKIEESWEDYDINGLVDRVITKVTTPSGNIVSLHTQEYDYNAYLIYHSHWQDVTEDGIINLSQDKAINSITLIEEGVVHRGKDTVLSQNDNIILHLNDNQTVYKDTEGKTTKITQTFTETGDKFIELKYADSTVSFYFEDQDNNGYFEHLKVSNQTASNQIFNLNQYLINNTDINSSQLALVKISFGGSGQTDLTLNAETIAILQGNSAGKPLNIVEVNDEGIYSNYGTANSNIKFEGFTQHLDQVTLEREEYIGDAEETIVRYTTEYDSTTYTVDISTIFNYAIATLD